MGSNPTPSAKQEARARKSAGFFYGQSGDETDYGAVASYEERKSKPVLIFVPRSSKTCVSTSSVPVKPQIPEALPAPEYRLPATVAGFWVVL